MIAQRSYLPTCMLAACVAIAGCSGASSIPAGLRTGPQSGSGSSPIQHVVLIVQENRSFDNLFAKFPGANGATHGEAKEGSIDKSIPLKAHSLLMSTDLQHCHAAFVTDYDGGKMDGFYDEGKGACPHGAPAHTLVYQYVKESDIEPYWDIAKQWVLADEMFQTQGSGSFTAHQDLIRGGTCIQDCDSSSTSTEDLVDTPTYWPWGCDAKSAVVTYTINIAGIVKENGPFPCSNKFPNYGSGGYETLRDLLDTAGVSWKYYTPCFSSKAEPDCTPSSDCNPSDENPCAANTLNAFDVIYPVRYGSEWGTNVSWPDTNIFSDITNGALPAVSWVIPEDDEDDHPDESVDDGPEWVASVVNAVGESSYWGSTAIIVLWDDWGGFYDNAVPKQFDDVQGGLGFRVPMMVISPYAIKGTGAKGGYISHTQYEFGSILAYIESNWNLGNLGTTDIRATPIGNVFNYNQSPRSFSAIPSKYSAQYFIDRPHGPQHGDPQ
jgi:phospholipase C